MMTKLELKQQQVARDALAFRRIQALLGYVELGTDQSVTIGQDDATNMWFVKAGGAHLGYCEMGDTLHGAIEIAVAMLVDEESRP